MYYRSETCGRCCIGADRRFVFTHRAGPLVYVKLVNYVVVAIDSVIRCVFTLSKFMPIFIQIRFTTTAFWRDRPNNNNNSNKSKNSMRADPDLKLIHHMFRQTNLR